MHRLILLLLLLSLALRLSARQDTTLHLQQILPSNDVWWQLFGDSTLHQLIQKASDNNYNLLNAIQNIQIAHSRLRIEQSGFYPSFSVTSQYTPEKSSLGIDKISAYSHIGQAAIAMNWEIDLFGSIRKNAKSQKEYYFASQEDYRGVMISLAAEVATAYIQLRTYQQQLNVARQNLLSQKEILQLNESQLKAGLTSSLTVAQAKGLWLQTKALLPGIEASIYNQVNAIAVLLGEYSDSLRLSLLKTAPLPPPSTPAIVGIPTDLVRRRPDVRSAERTMDALSASVGATRADWLPKFYLAGSIGVGSETFKEAFRKENRYWQISPSIQWTLFSGRKLVETTRAARLQLDEGINNYNQTLLTALQEIDNAIFTYNKSLQQLTADQEALAQIRLSLEYAVDLYKKGLTNYQTVLDSQRNLLAYENTFVNAQSTVLLYLIQTYKALGGGFNNHDTDLSTLKIKNKE
ncbi:MAG: efflux transporter outer membrane subunit [Odoribacter sp.]